MTPDESPSAPAKKGLDASCTNLSEKTTAAPKAVAEPATVVNTKPSSAFERPMVLFAALRGDGSFCSWAAAWLSQQPIAAAFEVVCACKHKFMSPMRKRAPVQTAESGLIAVLPSPFIARWHAFADAKPPRASAACAHAGPRRDAYVQKTRAVCDMLAA